ncbi:SacI homology domain-containing protein [Coemansia spiralis]|nr:SacI homology domain-containing protein [Coemansia spiralis]
MMVSACYKSICTLNSTSFSSSSRKKCNAQLNKQCFLLLFGSNVGGGSAHESLQDAKLKDMSSMLVHAVAGIFTLNLCSYILVVTRSKYRGSVRGCSIYEVDAVSALPLDYAGGKKAIQNLHSSMQREEQNKTSDTKSGDASDSSTGGHQSQAEEEHTGSSIEYSSSWLAPQLTKFFGRNRAESTTAITANATSETRQRRAGSAERMEQRIVEEIVRLFGSSGIFYSYEYDITRSLQSKNKHPLTSSSIPLAQVADPDYWFNRHLQKPLLAPLIQEWALPMIQGCVHAATCNVSNGDSFQVCILSRRCIRRIGMRYERRGANADGFVANSVETEQILSVDAGSQGPHYCSFVQTRGSMPFFWKQPPSGLHPVPVVVKGDKDNAAACVAHLQHEIDRLGRQVLVNLVEHKGREAVVGSKYASLVGQCVADDLIDACSIRYIPWDFHYETRGMRYENIKQLVSQLEREISGMGYYWSTKSQTFTLQKGAFRVNCMDCLDRTNVVQSAIARFVLNEQLVRLGIHIAPEQGLAAYAGLESTLNSLWANNGDYISRQYAGTSAMKGDFTRTGKRNISGVVNDASYSIARLWISTFRDYFSQSVLDFLMGNQSADYVYRTLIDLRSHEPDHATQMTRMRQAAIEASIAIVMSDGECVQMACIVQSPLTLNTVRMRGESDAVLILTNAAIYVCRYHYQMEKVSEFLRVDLSRLCSVQHGIYITETRTPQSLDPTRNHGIVLYFRAAVARFNSGSEQNQSNVGVDNLPDARQPADGEDKTTPKVKNNNISGASSVNEENNTESDYTSTGYIANAGDGVCCDYKEAPSYIVCKFVSDSQVVMQQISLENTNPKDTMMAIDGESNSTDVSSGSNGSNNKNNHIGGREVTSAPSLARLDSFAKQPAEMLAEFMCSAALSLKLALDPSVDERKFIVDAPIVSEATAKQNVNLLEKMSNRLHKAIWL